MLINYFLSCHGPSTEVICAAVLKQLHNSKSLPFQDCIWIDNFYNTCLL